MAKLEELERATDGAIAADRRKRRRKPPSVARAAFAAIVSVNETGKKLTYEQLDAAYQAALDRRSELYRENGRMRDRIGELEAVTDALAKQLAHRRREDRLTDEIPF